MTTSYLHSFLSHFQNHNFQTLNLITIDSSQILANYDLIAKLNPHCQIWPVLKSNAYGHGYQNIAKILKKREFEYLIIDSYHEALEIRKVNRHQNVLLIGSILPDNFNLLNYKHITLTIQDLVSLKALIKLNKKVVPEHSRKIKIHLKINTGMNRQGIELEEIPQYIRILKKHPNIILDGIFSHLADADNPNNSYTQYQLKLFQKAIDIFDQNQLNPRFIHLAATAGSVKINHPRLNAIRLGIGLYGYNPLTPQDSAYDKLKSLQPALTLTSTITKIRKVKKGSKVSYGLIYTLDRDSYIATIPVGYYDGIDRRLSNQGFINYPISSYYYSPTLFRKEDKKLPGDQPSNSGRFNSTKPHFYPIIGRVCMNIIIVNFGQTKPKLFDQVEFISPHPSNKNSITNIAKTCSTIPYDILVHLNHSIRRQII